MTAQAPSKSPEPGAPPPGGWAKFRRQFHAWWEGYYLEPDIAGNPPPPPEAEVKQEGDTWTPKRVKVAEMIWGDGFTFPGGIDYALDLVKPMKLNSEKSFL